MFPSPPQSPYFDIDLFGLPSLQSEVSSSNWVPSASDSFSDTPWESFSSVSVDPNPLLSFIFHQADSSSILPMDFSFSPSLECTLTSSLPLDSFNSSPVPSLSPSLDLSHTPPRARNPFKRPVHASPSGSLSPIVMPCASTDTFRSDHISKPQRRPTMKLLWQVSSTIPFPISLVPQYENWRIGEIIEQYRLAHRAVFLADASARLINADRFTRRLLNPLHAPDFSCFHIIHIESMVVCGYCKHLVVTEGRRLRGVSIKFNINERSFDFYCNISPLRKTLRGPVTAVQVNFIPHSSLSLS